MDVPDDATYHSLRGDIEVENRPKVRSDRLREQEHAKRGVKPYPVVIELAGLRSASLALRLPGGANDESDASGAPRGLAGGLPKGFHRRHPDRQSRIRDPWGWGLDLRARGDDLNGDAACISFHWHRQHCVAKMCGIRRPVPSLNHPKRSCMSWRPCPPLEGCLARPRLKRGRAPNLGSVFLS